MPNRVTRKSASRALIPEANIIHAFPACEYCGHDVYPGEEQEGIHHSLYWHRNGCFRCYGCHREFRQARTCFVLKNIALCEKCNPRREFLEEDWKTSNSGGNFDTKPRKVSFLSPVIKSRAPKADSLNESVSSGSRSPPHETEDDHGHGFASPSTSGISNSDPTESAVLHQTDDHCPEEIRPTVAAGCDSFHIEPPPGSPVHAERTPDANAQQPDIEPAPETSHVSVEDQISEAMAAIAPDNEPLLAPKESSFEEVPVEDVNGNVGVNHLFTVAAVDEWTELVVENVPGTDEVNNDAQVNEVQELETSGTRPVELTMEETPDDGENGNNSFNLLRRASSCFDLNEMQKLPQEVFEACLQNKAECVEGDSDDSMSWMEVVKSFTSSEDKEDVEDARRVDICCSPSPVPQSSTPIPQGTQDFVSASRPPSSLIDEQAWQGDFGSTTQTISPHGASFESNDDPKELHSFQERRAVFQKDKSTNIANCSVCKEPLFLREHFVCLNRAYHVRCFGCTRCKARLNQRTYCDDGNQPYCKSCYVERKVSKNSYPSSPSARKRLKSL